MSQSLHERLLEDLQGRIVSVFNTEHTGDAEQVEAQTKARECVALMLREAISEFFDDKPGRSVVLTTVAEQGDAKDYDFQQGQRVEKGHVTDYIHQRASAVFLEGADALAVVMREIANDIDSLDPWKAR